MFNWASADTLKKELDRMVEEGILTSRPAWPQ